MAMLLLSYFTYTINVSDAVLYRFSGADKDVQMRCVRTWTEWELSLCGLVPDTAFIQSKLADEQAILAKALIET